MGIFMFCTFYFWVEIFQNEKMPIYLAYFGSKWKNKTTLFSSTLKVCLQLWWISVEVSVKISSVTFSVVRRHTGTVLTVHFMNYSLKLRVTIGSTSWWQYCRLCRVLRKPLDDKGAELGDVSTSIWIFLNLPSLCIGMPKTDGVLSWCQIYVK